MHLWLSATGWESPAEQHRSPLFLLPITPSLPPISLSHDFFLFFIYFLFCSLLSPAYFFCSFLFISIFSSSLCNLFLPSLSFLLYLNFPHSSPSFAPLLFSPSHLSFPPLSTVFSVLAIFSSIYGFLHPLHLFLICLILPLHFFFLCLLSFPPSSPSNPLPSFFLLSAVFPPPSPWCPALPPSSLSFSLWSTTFSSFLSIFSSYLQLCPQSSPCFLLSMMSSLITLHHYLLSTGLSSSVSFFFSSVCNLFLLPVYLVLTHQ